MSAQHAVVAEGLKSAPPVTVTIVAWLQGLTIDRTLAYVTLGYVVIQAAYLIWKWHREYKRSGK